MLKKEVFTILLFNFKNNKNINFLLKVFLIWLTKIILIFISVLNETQVLLVKSFELYKIVCFWEISILKVVNLKLYWGLYSYFAYLCYGIINQHLTSFDHLNPVIFIKEWNKAATSKKSWQKSLEFK